MPRKNLKIVKLKKPTVEQNKTFIDTLVWILDMARSGSVLGYCGVVMIEEKGNIRTVEFAKDFDSDNKLHILGGIRKMELNFIKRSWPDEEV